MDPYLMNLCSKFSSSEEIENKTIIEVGSRNVNGSFRDILIKFKPQSYIGVDIVNGSYVDEICDICGLTTKFSGQQFDIVVCTEVIEHVKDWRNAIRNLMNITKTGGILYLTSRSKGFGMHGFPDDYWRYEIDDIKYIFQNWEILHLCKDLYNVDHFGFFLKARKINNLIPELDNYALYNIKTDPRDNPPDSHMIRTLE